MVALRIEGAGKTFAGQAVLRGLDLAVERGQLLAILGASGSGKTTLLRLICGFERLDRGRIVIGERVVAGPDLHLPPEQRHIGYVAQEGALFPHLSVAANILFGLPRRQRRETRRVEALLDLVGLPAAYAARPPQALSGGEQQRVALARALAPAPSLVLLDEPFSALDAGLRTETRTAVADALAAAGATALLVTHDQGEALSIGNAVAVLRDGRVAQLASPQDLYHHPLDAALARFVGEAVLLAGEVQDGRIRCGLGSLAAPPGIAAGAVEVLIRPEQIRLLPAGASPLRAEVLAVNFFGHDASVRLRLLDRPEAEVLSARVDGRATPEPGQVVSLAVTGAVSAFPAATGSP
jgi:iron(III) transport system ATP-binding protein